jgi:hypothetical protein
LAVLVIACLVVYMLAAQGAPGLSLSWPGKIQML